MDQKVHKSRCFRSGLLNRCDKKSQRGPEMDKLTVLSGHQREYWECCILVFTKTWMNFSTESFLFEDE